MAPPRFTQFFCAVNTGSFRISAMIMGQTEDGNLQVLGSGHRASNGIKRGYVTDMAAATYAIRDAVERAEKNAGGLTAETVLVGCAGAGLSSSVSRAEIKVDGRRIEDEDIELLLTAAREAIKPEGQLVLHAQPAHYTIDGARGVVNPRGMYAERLSVDVHVVFADRAPVRNLTEAVQKAHLDVEAVVAAPLATGYACLDSEERELGVALVEIGAEVTNVSVYAGGMLLGLKSIPLGSGDITDAVASAFGLRRFQAERLKCVSGSAIASPNDHREMIPLNGPGEDEFGAIARGADPKNRIARADLVSIVTQNLSILTNEIGRALKVLGFSGAKSGQVVITGGGAELAGLAEFLQSAIGMPVRVGKPPLLIGLPEAHSTPGFAALVGLCIYAAEEPADIRRGVKKPGLGIGRLFRAIRDNF